MDENMKGEKKRSKKLAKCRSFDAHEIFENRGEW